jgi:predicted anti-sigma-YlaC factor YlaD
MPASGDNCSWTLDRLDAFVDGELEGEERVSFESHLEECDSCRSELARARLLVSELRALPEFQCPPQVIARAETAVSRRPPRVSAVERIRGWLGGISIPMPRPAMAAMVLIIVAATVFVLSQHEQSPFNHDEPEAPFLTEKDAELAKLDVMLAFAYVGKYSRKTGEIIKKDVIEERVMKPVEKSVVAPIYPFPREK